MQKNIYIEFMLAYSWGLGRNSSKHRKMIGLIAISQQNLQYYSFCSQVWQNSRRLSLFETHLQSSMCTVSCQNNGHQIEKHVLKSENHCSVGCRYLACSTSHAHRAHPSGIAPVLGLQTDIPHNFKWLTSLLLLTLLLTTWCLLCWWTMVRWARLRLPAAKAHTDCISLISCTLLSYLCGTLVS